MIRKRIGITGITQGVGFRPFIYRVAMEHGWKGFVSNTSKGVILEAEGSKDALHQGLSFIRNHPPKRARIDEWNEMDLPFRNDVDFTIVPEENPTSRTINVSADLAMCDACRQELGDPTNPRYQYPFIACDDCGPRYSILLDIPYERHRITMIDFPMCSFCDEEYHRPANRRFRVESISCPTCGPMLQFADAHRGVSSQGLDALEEAVRWLKEGKILVIKGLCGYHIACDATDARVVETLRTRKRRPYKPFAIMVPDASWIPLYAHPDACTLLAQTDSPITTMPKIMIPEASLERANLASNVAPNNGYWGIMIPYTPLHDLLMRRMDRPLVMTSANLHSMPICFTEEQAFEQLATIVDGYLIHNRRITRRMDDSVSFAVTNSKGEIQPISVRNGRGRFPNPIIRPGKVKRSIMGVGAELKSTVSFLYDDKAILSHFIGDLNTLETYEYYQETIQQMMDLYSFAPEMIACDLHPEYQSTKWASTWAEEHRIPIHSVQHHRAHAAALCLEHHVEKPMLCFVWDGIGMGDDGAYWGSECFYGTPQKFDRIGHFDYFPLIGGNLAAVEPWRLWVGLLSHQIHQYPLLMDILEPFYPEALLKVHQSNRFVYPTSSMGRLFDAVGFLCGFHRRSSFEGEIAIMVESKIDASITDTYPFAYRQGTDHEWIVNTQALMIQILDDWHHHVPDYIIATKFHRTLVAIVVNMVEKGRQQFCTSFIGLTGGVFQNKFLLQQTLFALENMGCTVYLPHRIPPNDEGISVGQAYCASFLE